MTNTEIESKDRTRIYLHCDVLSTHKEYIKQCHGLVVKGGNINPYFRHTIPNREKTYIDTNLKTNSI